MTNGTGPNPRFRRIPDNTPLTITYEPYVVRRAQQDGEKDLVALARQHPSEGSWLYTPLDQNWYHISVGHTEQLDNDARLSAREAVGSFTIPGNGMIHYHTHPPKQVIDVNKDRVESSPSLRNIPYLVSSLSIYPIAISCFPSPQDIQAYATYIRDCGSTLYFHGRIASPIGITTVHILDNSVATLQSYAEVFEKVPNLIEEKGITSKIEGDKLIITIEVATMFDQINRSLEGKLRLNFFREGEFDPTLI